VVGSENILFLIRCKLNTTGIGRSIWLCKLIESGQNTSKVISGFDKIALIIYTQ